ncbi:MAG: hypothetical protein E7602_06415 [Ruminococcaceae bacterium]|nr:hypothetical protein [Oscillospiraceae bacterium]
MKVLKKIAPILLIITIVFCLLFCFLTIVREPIREWYDNKLEDSYYDWLESLFGKNSYSSNTAEQQSNSYISSNISTFEPSSDSIQTYPIQTSPSNDTIVVKPGGEYNISVIVPSDDFAHEEVTYYTADSSNFVGNALSLGSLPLLSTFIGRLIKPVGFLASIYTIITNSLVPVSIIIISIIALAFYLAISKSKTSLYSSGALAKVLKIFSLIALGIGILASLFICLTCIPNVIFNIVDLFKALFHDNSITYWSKLSLTLVELLLGLTDVAVFFLITISQILFLIITIKSGKKTRLPSKKPLIVLCVLSAIGTFVSAFVSFHFTVSIIISIIRIIILFFEYGATAQAIFSMIMLLFTSFGLIALALSVTVGFIITLAKVIISLKKSSKKELYAYNSEELSCFDVPEEINTSNDELVDDVLLDEGEKTEA